MQGLTFRWLSFLAVHHGNEWKNVSNPVTILPETPKYRYMCANLQLPTLQTFYGNSTALLLGVTPEYRECAGSCYVGRIRRLRHASWILNCNISRMFSFNWQRPIFLYSFINVSQFRLIGNSYVIVISLSQYEIPQRKEHLQGEKRYLFNDQNWEVVCFDYKKNHIKLSRS